MVTLCDWPGVFTTSIPLPVMVNVCDADPTLVTVMLSPFLRVRVVGANTSPPGPCWRVVPAALGDALVADAAVAGWVGFVEGLELLLQAAPTSASTAARPTSHLAPLFTCTRIAPVCCTRSKSRRFRLAKNTGDGARWPYSLGAPARSPRRSARGRRRRGWLSEPPGTLSLLPFRVRSRLC